MSFCTVAATIRYTPHCPSCMLAVEHAVAQAIRDVEVTSIKLTAEPHCQHSPKKLANSKPAPPAPPPPTGPGTILGVVDSTREPEPSVIPVTTAAEDEAHGVGLDLSDLVMHHQSAVPNGYAEEGLG